MNYSEHRMAEAANEEQLLADAENAIRNGDRDYAHRLSIEATRIAPDSIDAWLMRSRTAASMEESMHSLSQVNRIDPNHPGTKLYSYQALWSLVERDPFLAYVDETDELYHVRSKDYLSVIVPKDRAVPEQYPPRKPQPLAPAYRWLLLALFGLAFSGVGTLIFAPLAALSAVQAGRRSLSKEDRIRSKVVTWLSIFLLAPALLLGFIFLVHFRGF